MVIDDMVWAKKKLTSAFKEPAVWWRNRHASKNQNTGASGGTLCGGSQYKMLANTSSVNRLVRACVSWKDITLLSPWASLVAQTVKCLPAVQEIRVQSLGWEDPLEKGMAAHSSTLAWKIPWVEEPGRLQSMVSLRVGHDWETSLSLSTFMHWRRKWQPTPAFLPGKSQGRGSLVGCHLWGHTELDMTEVT